MSTIKISSDKRININYCEVLVEYWHSYDLGSHNALLGTTYDLCAENDFQLTANIIWTYWVTHKNKVENKFKIFDFSISGRLLEMYYRPEYLWAILIVNMDQLFIGLGPNFWYSDILIWSEMDKSSERVQRIDAMNRLKRTGAYAL